MKRYLYTLIGILFIMPVYGQFIESLDCEELFKDSFVPKKVFIEPAEICFYGSGFSDSSVTVNLDNSDNSYSIVVPVTHTIITSISKKYFTNVAAGEYVFSVTASNGQVINRENVTVHAEDTSSEDINGEIPEFSTVFAIIILLSAGAFIMKTRKQVLK